MSVVEAITRTVYRSPRARRCYLTKRSAFYAEARAIIKARYPNERAEYEDGHMIYPGSDWRSLPNWEKLERRVARMVRAAYEANSPAMNLPRVRGHEETNAAEQGSIRLDPPIKEKA